MIIVLSVFNGLGELIRSLHQSVDPEIKIELKKGKTFSLSDHLRTQIITIPEINTFSEVLEENALIKYNGQQMVVKLKGVSDTYVDNKKFQNTIVEGNGQLRVDTKPRAIVGLGVKYKLDIKPKNDFYALQVFSPMDIRPGVKSMEKMFNRRLIMPGGVFSVEKNYDENYIFVPISFSEDLFQAQSKRTSLEIGCKPEHVKLITTQLRDILGDKFHYLDDEAQHREIYNLLRVEKIFAFLAFSLILAVASFNIFFSLSMLAIEKKKDISVFYAFGTTQIIIHRIFFYEGFLIGAIGTGTGLLIGLLITWVQDQYGLLKLGMSTTVVDAYPVKIEILDVVVTALIVFGITLLASLVPARLSSKNIEVKDL